MQDFPILDMKPGDRVIVAVDGGPYVGDFQKSTNDPNDGGFAVMLKLKDGSTPWFYVAQGAKFYRS